MADRRAGFGDDRAACAVLNREFPVRSSAADAHRTFQPRVHQASTILATSTKQRHTGQHRSFDTTCAAKAPSIRQRSNTEAHCRSQVDVTKPFPSTLSLIANYRQKCTQWDQVLEPQNAGVSGARSEWWLDRMYGEHIFPLRYKIDCFLDGIDFQLHYMTDAPT